MRRFRQFQENGVAAITTGAILLLIVALTEWPDGWRTSLCLIPIVVTACCLSAWYLAVVGVLTWILSDVFSFVPWVPRVEMVLGVVSVILLIRMRQLHEDLRSKEAQLQAKRKSQQEWQAFFENSPAAILSADGRGKIVMANPAAHKLFGVEDRRLEGEALDSYLPDLTSALRIDREGEMIRNITQCRGWRPSCAMFMADVCFSICETTGGRRLGAVMIDASERLQEYERGAVRSSVTTSQIAMGAVLHEIRNLSAAAALMNGNLERVPELRENADFEALGNLLRAMTKIASTELRPGEGSNGSVDLRALLEELRIIIESWFQESEIRVNWQIAADLPPVWGEKRGLMQIFMNLAQNSNKAMNASRQKRLTISAELKGRSVIVRFLDTGPGVAAPDELFQPFNRGTGVKGLGLYISRAIAHSISGDLRCEPVPVGSCFVVELIPLREWQNVADEYGNATAHQNSSY